MIKAENCIIKDIIYRTGGKIMEFIKYGIKKHQYLSVFIAWLFAFLALGRFDIEKVLPINYISVIFLGIGIIIADILFMKKRCTDEKTLNTKLKKTLILSCSGIAYTLLMLYVFSIVPLMPQITGRNICVPFFFSIALFIGAAVYLSVKKKWNDNIILIYIFSLCFIFHMTYFIAAGLNYQYDLGYLFGNGNGHIGYIEYIYNNYSLPQFDPREKWQYYHPPFHHIISAVFLRIHTFFGTDIRVAIYNLQFLPLLYYMITLLTFYKLSRELGLKKKYAVILLAILAFSPAFFYIANYVNNDMMSIMWMMLSVYFAVKWYKTRKASDIIKTAFSFGAGMFTKLSVWMCAVPIAIIFISALIENIKNKDKKEFTRLFGQMWTFLGIAAPLSLYWSLRNYFRFGVPIGFIPQVDDNRQLIEEPVLKRLFDFDIQQFKYTWVTIKGEDGDFNEYNPLIALIKSSGPAMKESPVLNRIVLTSVIILAIVSFICMIYVLVKKNTIPKIYKTALVAFYLTTMICYYVFCIKYPNVCTEEIRYASPVIFIGAFFTAYALYLKTKSSTPGNKFIRYFILFASVLFCISSISYISYDIIYNAIISNM